MTLENKCCTLLWSQLPFSKSMKQIPLSLTSTGPLHGLFPLPRTFAQFFFLYTPSSSFTLGPNIVSLENPTSVFSLLSVFSKFEISSEVPVHSLPSPLPSQAVPKTRCLIPPGSPSPFTQGLWLLGC